MLVAIDELSREYTINEGSYPRPKLKEASSSKKRVFWASIGKFLHSKRETIDPMSFELDKCD